MKFQFFTIYFVFQSAFYMNDTSSDSLQDVQDIKRLMERSSRFISLSGLSGISAGLCALIGVCIARYIILGRDDNLYNIRNNTSGITFTPIAIQLLLLAAGVFVVAFFAAFYFTWKKAGNQGVPLWNHTSRRLFWNMVIPLAAGALFIIGMLQNGEWKFAAPASLIFYGLALVNASKYTLTDIRYLGYCEIVLGILNMQWLGEGLYFWAIGFGILHILYGIIMWWKYERKAS